MAISRWQAGCKLCPRRDENNLVLGQLAAEEKSNEITAIPELLDLIDVSGDTITIDAAD
jgi:hypothetical protein